MAEKDVYEALLDLYRQDPFDLSQVTDSLMEVLRLQFTPEEAELAVTVGFDGGVLDQIQRRCGIPKSILKKKLYTMAEKGTMWITPRSKDPVYKTIGIAGPGLLETGGWGNVRFPHSLPLMKALHKFEHDFTTKSLANLGMPSGRVWATPAALPDDVKPSEDVTELIKEAGYWGVSVCSCRLPHWVADPGNHCEHMLETCLFLGNMARWGVEHGMCREISYNEAVDLLYKCNENGLVHTYDPNMFICNCCHDCCVFFVGIRETGAKMLLPSEFVARMDSETCTACQVCAERCPVDAIEVDAFATVDGEKCLGCGVCYPTCPSESVSLVRRPVEQVEIPENIQKKIEEFSAWQRRYEE
jgi:electron transport complex protein RnfB